MWLVLVVFFRGLSTPPVVRHVGLGIGSMCGLLLMVWTSRRQLMLLGSRSGRVRFGVMAGLAQVGGVSEPVSLLRLIGTACT